MKHSNRVLTLAAVLAVNVVVIILLTHWALRAAQRTT